MLVNIYDESFMINRECVTLRLFQADDGLMLERELAEPAGNKLVQAIPVHCERYMQAFLKADPYYPQLEESLGRIKAKAAAHLAQHTA